MKQLVLITGASGQLGKAMTEQLVPRHEVVGLGRAELDVTNGAAALATITAICPDVIVNCSAYTNVDGAETDPGSALAANAWGVKTLARAAADINATLVHFSTDFVFDGSSDRPYREDDAPNPRGTYAVSKLLGEWFATEAPTWYVLRVESLFGGPHRRSSVDRIVDLVRSGQPAPVFVDRVVSPSFVTDVADASAFILRTRPAAGLYHCVNSGYATWLTVGQEIVRRLGELDSALKPISVNDVKLRAERPQFAALDNAKLAKAGYKMPTWQDAIGRYLSVPRPQSSLRQGENGGQAPL